MTCIAGACKGGRVWLGGDACASTSSVRIAMTDPKVWRSGGVLLGGCGDPRGLDLAKRIDCPEKPDEGWLRYGLSAALAKICREVDGDRRPDSNWLVGALGSLWVLDGDFAIYRVGDYAATGSGEELALGAMHARPRANPRERVRAGLAAAAAHSPSCSEPFTLVNL